MRSRSARAIVLLMSGALFSLVLAWSLAPLAGRSDRAWFTMSASSKWPRSVPASWGRPAQGVTSVGLGFAWTSMDAAPGPKEWHRFERVSWGLPFPCMSIEWLSSSLYLPGEVVGGTPCRGAVRFGGVEAPYWVDELLRKNGYGGSVPRKYTWGTVLPTCPAWLFLVANSLFWHIASTPRRQCHVWCDADWPQDVGAGRTAASVADTQRGLAAIAANAAFLSPLSSPRVDNPFTTRAEAVQGLRSGFSAVSCGCLVWHVDAHRGDPDGRGGWRKPSCNGRADRQGGEQQAARDAPPRLAKAGLRRGVRGVACGTGGMHAAAAVWWEHRIATWKSPSKDGLCAFWGLWVGCGWR
jgi:hypothetical protein